MTAHVVIDGIQRRLPIVRIDGKDYFIMGGTYQVLPNEREVNEQYDTGGGIDVQVRQTDKWRWVFTLLVPYNSYCVETIRDNDNGALDIGYAADLRASSYKTAPDDLLGFYDITAFEDFTGSYTHLVYLQTEWWSPDKDDPGKWQVPVKLWGYEA